LGDLYEVVSVSVRLIETESDAPCDSVVAVCMKPSVNATLIEMEIFFARDLLDQPVPLYVVETSI